jgi:hypothetical protein
MPRLRLPQDCERWDHIEPIGAPWSGVPVSLPAREVRRIENSLKSSHFLRRPPLSGASLELAL